MSTEQVIKASVSCARSSNGLIYLTIECEKSHAKFAEIVFTPNQFANVITNLHTSDIDVKVNHLDRVGKTRILEPRQVRSPIQSYSREKNEQWLREHCQEEGWLLNSYLGSQKSIQMVDGVTLLNYSVYKYI